MRRRAFTLVEMLMVIAIIAILAAMAIAALAGAAEQGKRQRAEAQIAKIDQLLSEKWNSYRYRQLPLRIPAGTSPATAARCRLYAMRDLMRMEMPDRYTDILDGPAVATPLCPYTITQRPSLQLAYLRRLQATPPTASTAWDQAECLYLILAETRDGEDSALQHFLPSEIGDVDADGLNEILDPWGTPIMWLRWAPGHSKYTSSDPELADTTNIPTIDTAVDTPQVPNGLVAPDPFDPLKSDPRWSDSTPGVFRPFALFPLVWSAGSDQRHDIAAGQTDASGNPNLNYRTTNPPNDPYVGIAGGIWLGMPNDVDNDGQLSHGDNISNHGLGLRGE